MSSHIPNLQDHLQYHDLFTHVFDDILGDLPLTIIGLEGIKETMGALSRPLSAFETYAWRTITEITDHERSQAKLARLHELFKKLVNSRGRGDINEATIFSSRPGESHTPVMATTRFGSIQTIRQRIDNSKIDIDKTLGVSTRNNNDFTIFYYENRLWTVVKQDEENSDYYNTNLQLRLLLEELGFYHNHMLIHDEINFIGRELSKSARNKKFRGFSINILDKKTWLPLGTFSKPTTSKSKGRPLVINSQIPQEIMPAVLRNLQIVAQTLKKVGIVMDSWKELRVDRFTGEVSFDTENHFVQMLDEDFLSTALLLPETFNDILEEIRGKPTLYYFPNLTALLFGYEEGDISIISSELQLNKFIKQLSNALGISPPDKETIVEEAVKEFHHSIRIIKNHVSKDEDNSLHEEISDNIELIERIIRYYLDTIGAEGFHIFLSRALPNILDRFEPGLWFIQAKKEINKALDNESDNISSYWADDFHDPFWEGEVVRFKITKKGGGNSSGNGPLAPVTPINGGPVSPPPTFSQTKGGSVAITTHGLHNPITIPITPMPHAHITPNMMRGGLGMFRGGLGINGLSPMNMFRPTFLSI